MRQRPIIISSGVDCEHTAADDAMGS